MTLEQRLILLAQAIGADIKTLTVAQGSLTSLTTTAKSNLVAAINELKSITDGLAGGGAAINDAAGDGDTTVTWSADKIFDSIAAASAALKNELTNGAGAALDTLAELADALGTDLRLHHTPETVSIHTKTGVFSLPLRALSTLLLWQRRMASRRQLARLDSRLLADAGISESQRYEELSKPFWR